MKLNEVTYGAGQPIDGYTEGGFRVGGRLYDGAVLVAPGGVTPWDGTAASILALADAIDVLLIGTGAEIAHPDPALRDPLEAAGLGVEAMASAQAARTYNVLLGEGRRVAAALRPVA